MAFDAGAIEATLTLNRNPFTVGLAAARKQAASFERDGIEVPIKPTLDRAGMLRLKEQLDRITGNATVRARFDRTSLARIRDQINRSVGNINVRAKFDNASLVAIRERINRSVATITVRASLDNTSLQALRARIAAARFVANVEVRADRELIRGLSNDMGSFTANTRNASRETENFGNVAQGAFSGAGFAIRALLTTAPLLLPVMGSAIVGSTGLVMGLVSALGIAGAGLGAFALVAGPTFSVVSEGAKKSDAEIRRLPPGIAQAAAALKQLKSVYDTLVAQTRGGVGNAMAAGFQAATAAIRPLTPLINAVSTALTGIGKQMTEYFNSKHWTGFVTFLQGSVGPILQRLFEIVAYGTRAVMNLVRAFEPLAQWILQGIADGMAKFAQWTEKLGENKDFQAFLAQVKESLPKIWAFIQTLIEFLFRLSMALAPIGDLVLDVFTKVFDALNKIPPEFLGPIAVGIAGIFAALILGASGPVGVAIGAVLGVAAAFKYLYDNSKTVRDFFDGMIQDLKAWFQPFWEDMVSLFNTRVKPAWDDLTAVIRDKFGPVIKDLWEKFRDNVLPALSDIGKTIMDKVIPAFLEFMKAIAPVVAFLWDKFGTKAIEGIEAMIRIIDGGLKIISGIFTTFSGLITGDWTKFWDGLKGIAEGFWTAIAGTFGLSLDELKQKYNEWDQWIMDKWNSLWSSVSTAFTEWADSFATGWNNFWTGIQAFFQGIADFMSQTWNNFTTWLTDTWNNFTTWLSTNWNNFWTGVKTFAEMIWNNLVEAWNRFWDGVRTTAVNFITTVKTAWDNFWQGVHDTAVRIWEAIKSVIGTALDVVKNTVSTAADQIGIIWRKVANFFREPINWVIRVVINDGVLKAWNTVMGWIGAEGIKADNLPEIPAFATGGPVRGGTPNKDSVQAWLMPGEYVLSKRAIENMGGLSVIHQWHESARRGFTSPVAGLREGKTAQALMAKIPMDGLGFAYGGVQPHVAAAGDEIVRVFGPMPGGIGGVGARANASDHPSGHALDFMTLSNVGLGDRVADYLYANAARMALKYEIWRQRIRNPGGGWVGMENRGSPTANHMDHVHASFLGGGGSAGANIGGAAQAQVVSWWSQIGSKVTELFSGLKNLIPGMPGGGAIGDALEAIPGGLIQKALDALREKLMNMFTTIFTPAGGAAMGALSGAIVDQVRAVAKRYGWDQGPQWDALAAIIQKESSWNPAAANPNSSARGLFQKMTSIHGPVEPTVTGQAEWGLNYIKNRYGDPVNALHFHNSHGYYKNGGWLMPGAYSYNETYEPEAIFNRPQITAMHEAIRNAGRRGALDDEFVEKIIRALQGGGDGGGVNIGSVTLPYGASVKELSDECFFRTRHAHKGRYGR